VHQFVFLYEYIETDGQQNIKHEMYLERNIQVRSRNHCCSRKAIAIIYPECVSIALVIQCDKVTLCVYCHLWPLRLYSNLSTLSFKR